METVGNLVLALVEGGYSRGTDFEVLGDWKIKPLERVLEWRNLDNPMPTEDEIVTWWTAYQVRSQLEEAAYNAKLGLIMAWGERAASVAAAAPYFKASSDVIWQAIEMGKPNVEAQEIDALYTAFKAAIDASPFWADSHNWVFEMYDVALNVNNPLHASHGAKAFQIIAWYSFNVVASSVAAQAIQLSLANTG